MVPGYIGARSVKWVNAITVQPGPSENYFQASDYRILPPEADPDTAAPGDGIFVVVATSQLRHPRSWRRRAGPCRPAAHQRMGTGRRGTRDRPRRRLARRRPHVATSRPATRNQPVGMAAVVPDGKRSTRPISVTARAWDETGVTQPESPAHLWNPRRYGNNAWAQVKAFAKLGIRHKVAVGAGVVLNSGTSLPVTIP